jgi:hypothetical protein
VNSKFCGECVCDDHSKKKRPNPANIMDKSEVERVCDECDMKYIKRIILEKNYAKNIEVDKQIASVQGEITLEQKRAAVIKEKIAEIEKQVYQIMIVDVSRKKPTTSLTYKT